MSPEQELAKMAAEYYGTPEGIDFLLQFNVSMEGREGEKIHLLRQAGLHKAMITHARSLKQQGRGQEYQSVHRHANILFGSIQ